MKPEIAYVYNKLKRLRFDFNKTDFECFRSDYHYEPTLKRYVRKDDNDLFIDKNTFKPLEEELEYADKCHELESGVGCPLEEIIEFIRLLKKTYYVETTGLLSERWSPFKSNEEELYKINHIFNKIKDKSA